MPDTIKLYTTHCPKCKVVEQLLNKKGLDYTTEDDIEKMMALGLQSAPALEADGRLMDFSEAVRWLKEQ